MDFDFDRMIDRRQSDSSKWHKYGPEVLPLWVADMDFPAPPPVLEALRQRVEHGVLGYGWGPKELVQVLVDRMQQLYNWQVEPEAIVFLPGVVVGFNLVARALTQPGDGILLQTPVYYPMLDTPGNTGCALDQVELTRQAGGRYAVDMAAFEAAITERTRLFLLCSPHNPVGRVFDRGELERMAEICLRHGVLICSDEIHCDLLFPGHHHIPTASLDPEVAQQTVTLMAPSKTFNVAGLHCSFAVVPNAEMRLRIDGARSGLVSRTLNVMGWTAALAAYRDGQPWLDALLTYLDANRSFLARFVAERLPGVRMHLPDGTYLAWLDCRRAGIEGNPHEFFLHQAKVAVNDGQTFGRGGEGFVRLNFACPRSTLAEALERMATALAEQKSTI